MKIIVELEVSFELEIADDSSTDDMMTHANTMLNMVAQDVYGRGTDLNPQVIVSDVYEWED